MSCRALLLLEPWLQGLVVIRDVRGGLCLGCWLGFRLGLGLGLAMGSGHGMAVGLGCCLAVGLDGGWALGSGVAAGVGFSWAADAVLLGCLAAPLWPQRVIGRQGKWRRLAAGTVLGGSRGRRCLRTAGCTWTPTTSWYKPAGWLGRPMSGHQPPTSGKGVPASGGHHSPPRGHTSHPASQHRTLKQARRVPRPSTSACQEAPPAYPGPRVLQGGGAQRGCLVQGPPLPELQGRPNKHTPTSNLGLDTARTLAHILPPGSHDGPPALLR